MSYNVPSQDPGIVSTDPPSTPCTGDFLEKLHCTEHGWFLWVGAFCVLVVICGICSCYVVAPALRLWRERQEEKEDQRSRGLSNRQRHSGHGRTSGRGGASGDAAEGREASNSSADGRQGGYHHWYLDNALKITPEDKMELGPRHGSPAYTTTSLVAPAAAASGGRRRQHDASRRRSQHHRDRQKKSEVVATSSATRRRGRSSMSSGKGPPGGARPPVLRVAGRGGDDGSSIKGGRVKSIAVGGKKDRRGGEGDIFTAVNTDANAGITVDSAPATARGRMRRHRHRHHRHKATAASQQANAQAATSTTAHHAAQ